MAEHESTMKSYWQSRERFADLFNFLLKEKVVEAEKLSDWGTEFKAMLQSTKRCAASDGEVLVMEDDHAFYILLVVQEGASACLVMPAQAKFYAALIYREQIKKIRGRHRKEKEREQYPSLHAFLRAVVVPEMQIKLKQGFGRAIRTETDTCVVAILDERAAKDQRYWKDVLTTLPEMPITQDLHQVEAFIRGVKPDSYFQERTA